MLLTVMAIINAIALTIGAVLSAVTSIDTGESGQRRLMRVEWLLRFGG